MEKIRNLNILNMATLLKIICQVYCQLDVIILLFIWQNIKAFWQNVKTLRKKD